MTSNEDAWSWAPWDLPRRKPTEALVPSEPGYPTPKRPEPHRSSSSSDGGLVFQPTPSATLHDATGLRLAIADGATEAMLASRWSDLLVGYFVGAPPGTDLASIIEYAQKQWPTVVERYLTDREKAGRPLKWYEQPGFERGSYSTILGAELVRQREGYSLEACAIGDSCLFRFRQGRADLAFPITRSDEFGSSPGLVPSKRPHPPPDTTEARDSRSQVVHAAHPQESTAGTTLSRESAVVHSRVTGRQNGRLTGRVCVPGDTLVLATDALALAILKGIEKGDRLTRLLPMAGTQKFSNTDYSNWVSEQRQSAKLRDDDTTLLLVSVH